MFSNDLYPNLKKLDECTNHVLALLIECLQRIDFLRYVDKKNTSNPRSNRKIKLHSLLICHSHLCIHLLDQ